MVKEKVLVVGLGEIGYPILELLVESRRFLVYGIDIDPEKMRELRQDEIPTEVEVVHICIPCFSRDKFVNVVANYVKRFKPKLTVINSTVPPGTTMDVYKRSGETLVAHSPVRGFHRNREHMKSDLKTWTKYVGGANKKAAETTREHFEMLGMKTKVLKSCLETELAKLFETTYRAWMITCFQEMHRISRHFKAEFDDVADFLEDTHRVRFDRPVMFPGVIGKHCLIPNIKLLLESYDSRFLRLVLESNEKRKEEVKDKDVLAEVEKIEKRAAALEKDLMSKNP
jgi:UDP-N-acetyl-D-mannosaminuronate dehydrogenase